MPISMSVNPQLQIPLVIASHSPSLSLTQGEIADSETGDQSSSEISLKSVSSSFDLRPANLESESACTASPDRAQQLANYLVLREQTTQLSSSDDSNEEVDLTKELSSDDGNEDVDLTEAEESSVRMDSLNAGFRNDYSTSSGPQ